MNHWRSEQKDRVKPEQPFQTRKKKGDLNLVHLLQAVMIFEGFWQNTLQARSFGSLPWHRMDQISSCIGPLLPFRMDWRALGWKTHYKQGLWSKKDLWSDLCLFAAFMESILWIWSILSRWSYSRLLVMGEKNLSGSMSELRNRMFWETLIWSSWSWAVGLGSFSLDKAAIPNKQKSPVARVTHVQIN